MQFSTICKSMIIYDIIMMHIYFNYIIRPSQYFQVDQASTMYQQPLLAMINQKTIKFPKSNSLSSLKTQSEHVYEKDLITRKVSQQQKQKLISLITADNFSMKDAAKYVRISYSTAKKVFTKFRHDLRESLRKKTQARLCKKRASYIAVQQDNFKDLKPVKTVSLVAGIEQRRTDNIVLITNYDC